MGKQNSYMTLIGVHLTMHQVMDIYYDVYVRLQLFV